MTLYDLVRPLIIKKYDPLQSSKVPPFQQYGKIWPTFFLSDFYEKKFGYQSDNFKKKNLYEKMFEKLYEIFLNIFRLFFCLIYFCFNFFCGGVWHPHTPTGAAPLDPACFRIDDSSGNRFALNGIS